MPLGMRMQLNCLQAIYRERCETFDMFIDELDYEEICALDLFTGCGSISFELVSRGVNHIVTVDVNDLQPLVFKLRKAAIMTLKPSQFEQFLIDSKGYRFMAQDVYKDVREAFDKSDEPTINFWDNIIFGIGLIKFFFVFSGIKKLQFLLL